MKIVPSEFSNSAWNYFIFAKEIAYKNYQQNVDSDNILLALIKEDNITKKILKKNNVNIKEFEKEIISSLNSIIEEFFIKVSTTKEPLNLEFPEVGKV